VHFGLFLGKPHKKGKSEFFFENFRSELLDIFMDLHGETFAAKDSHAAKEAASGRAMGTSQN
jgi:hypothetical protein